MRYLKICGISLDIILIPKFLVIFTNILNHQLIQVIFDKFLVEGVNVFFKLCIIAFEMIMKELEKSEEV